MNQEILGALQAELSENPSLNLDHEMPRIQLEFKKNWPTKPAILQPLSDAAKLLIFGTVTDDGVSHNDSNLDRGVRRVLENATVITKLLGRGGILRCRDTVGLDVDIAIKIVPASTNSPKTEYSALQYLAQHASDFPAPKPHGLLQFVHSKLIMMSYIPSTTLHDVWPSLSRQNKLSIQRQLDQLFKRLRDLKQQPGGRLGGVGGEGVSDSHAWVDHADSETVMTTASEFRDFQFSIEAACGVEYAAFLKSLLPHPDPNVTAVFTHGDVFPKNIIVDRDPVRPAEYVVTGIIDWEEAGFYPPWFESSKVLYTFNEDKRTDMQDWWMYVPDCIAPASYPSEWAVGRLWDKANGINV
ncbi:kinase-like domain-containing protein [Chaetomium fimeti]|uniref:Kinase-like domain-containing protein n=1 Tax=Chaetomium fimeti TaxID=1854472 RepID=A0AAE0HEP0_9PEZI|nr:kinase-like domain-containing protein [Chaetomium fimeti]